MLFLLFIKKEMKSLLCMQDIMSVSAANTRCYLVSHRIYRILENSLYRGDTPHRTSRFFKDKLGLDFHDNVNIKVNKTTLK
jgi:hypothetical protein